MVGGQSSEKPTTVGAVMWTIVGGVDEEAGLDRAFGFRSC